MSDHEHEPIQPESSEDPPEIQPPPNEPEYERVRSRAEAAAEAGDIAMDETVEPVPVEEKSEAPAPPDETAGADDPIVAYLKSVGAPEATILQVRELMASGKKELLMPLLHGVGLHGEQADNAAEVLSWSEVRLRIEKLVELGLPDDEATRDSMHELIMANREAIQRQVIYDKLSELGLLNLHPHSKEDVEQYRAVIEAVNESEVELRREFLERRLIPRPSANKKEQPGLKKAAEQQIERLLKLPAGKPEEIIRIRLGALGFSDEQISKIFKPVKPSDKFSGLRRSHFGGWGEDGKYNFVYDPARVAERTHIPQAVLVAAAEHGISPEYLNQARSNEAAGKYLREQGIEWGPDPARIDASTEDSSIFNTITDEDLERASKIAGAEITSSYVEMAKTEANSTPPNLFPAEYLASIGIPLLKERMEPPDPVTDANRVGRDRRQAVAQLAEDIEKNPGAISRSLRRPASILLPRIFYENPVLRFAITDRLNSAWAPFGKRILAWAVARKELHDRPRELEELRQREENLIRKKQRIDDAIRDGNLDSLPENQRAMTADEVAEMEDLKGRIGRLQARLHANKGFLRIGLPEYRDSHDYIDTLDESINSHRRQLSLIHRDKLHDINTAIDRLSARVFDARESMRVLRERRKINDHDDPTYIYNHERFKKQRNAFIGAHIEDRHEAMTNTNK